MTSAELEILAITVSMLGLGGGALLALKMFFTYRVQRLKASSANPEAVEALTQDVAALRDGMLALRDEIGDLQERVEFAERLLSKGREDPRHPLKP